MDSIAIVPGSTGAVPPGTTDQNDLVPYCWSKIYARWDNSFFRMLIAEVWPFERVASQGVARSSPHIFTVTSSWDEYNVEHMAFFRMQEGTNVSSTICCAGAQGTDLRQPFNSSWLREFDFAHNDPSPGSLTFDTPSGLASLDDHPGVIKLAPIPPRMKRFSLFRRTRRKRRVR